MNGLTHADELRPEISETVESPEFAHLLALADVGQPEAWNRIYALLYSDLHRIARSQIRRQVGPNFSPTSLISETWLKLAGARFKVESRRHLMSLIARAMRFVLIDETRRMLSEAHAEGERVAFQEPADAGAQTRLEQLLTLDQALTGLARIDERLARVVELRYFGGLSEREAAEVLGVTERTVSRDWRKARAFLVARLGSDEGGIGAG